MRKTICFLMIILMFCFSVNAQDFKILSEDMIELSVLGRTPNDVVSVTVLKHGQQLSNADSAQNQIDVFLAYKEFETDSEGKFMINLKTKESSGIFPLILSADKNGDIVSSNIYYIRLSENQIARQAIDDNADISTVISDNVYKLGIDDKLVNDDVLTTASTIYKGSVAEKAVNLTPEQVWENLNKALVISNITHSKISLFSEFYDYLNIDENVQKWIDKEYMTAEAKSVLNSKLSRNYSDFTSFEEDVLKATVLTTVSKCDGYGYVKEILTQFATKFAIPTKKITDAVCVKIVGKNYENIDVLKTAINNYYGNDVPSGGSGGAGGGGGGSMKPSSTPQDELVSIDSSYSPTAPAPYVEQKVPFSDIESYDWAKEAINYLYNLSIVNGKESGKFAPQDNVLREEFVKMAMNSIGISDLYGDVNFDDVPKDSWFYNDVKNAYLSGIISGISETSFGSGRMITRQDMAKILYNALVKKGVSFTDEKDVTFFDNINISDYATEAVGILSSCGIINGDENGCFNPQSFATRAETAKMIYNALMYIGRGVK